MPTFRCTARLAKRLGVELAADVPIATGTFGDWYANVLNVGRARYVVCLSSRTLLAVVMPARKAEFPVRFPDHLGTVLGAIGVPSDHIESELRALGAVAYAKTQDRSLIGSLNDFIHLATYHLQTGDSPLEATLMLTETPAKVIGYRFPADVAREAVEARG